MTDNKLTDNEIIKALEYCYADKNNCKRCPYMAVDKCHKVHTKDVLDLINRLRAQNEVYETCNARKDEAIKSLESRLKKLQMQFDDISKMYSEIKAEAYKEFAEKIEERIAVKILKDKSNEYAEGFVDALDGVNGEIDNLLKELVGDNP